MPAIKETNVFCIKNEVVPLQSQQCQIILVSCQQCIVWWSCQCHLRFVFYVICKSATFLRDITFVILRFKFPYWVNLQEGGKRREPQSASDWLSKSIDLKYVIIVSCPWRTWKSSNRGPEICRCNFHPQYLFSSSNTRAMTTWALQQFLITMDVEQQAVTFFVLSSIRLMPRDTFISYYLI